MDSSFKRNAHAETVKCKLEYLPVALIPSHGNTVKWNMDNIVQIMKEIGTVKCLFMQMKISTKKLL